MRRLENQAVSERREIPPLETGGLSLGQQLIRIDHSLSICLLDESLANLPAVFLCVARGPSISVP